MKKAVFIIILILLNINIVNAKEQVKFSDCVDGDTIKVLVKNKEKTLRLLAVDTPESVHPTKKVEYYGKEASNFTCEKVKNAKSIEIEYDENSDKEDKYDRLLVWLFVDDKLFQEQLVENGYAKVAYLYGDYKYTKDLEKVQEIAQNKNLGIWNKEEEKQYNENHNIIKKEETKKQEENINQQLTFKEIVIILILCILLAILSKNKQIKKIIKFIKKLK